MRAWWQRQATGLRVLWILLAAVIVFALAAAVTAGIVTLVRGPAPHTGTEAEAEAGSPPGQTDLPRPGAGAGAGAGAGTFLPPGSGTSAGSASTYGLDHPMFEIDGRGLVTMPGTTDPRETAAAAAAVLFTVDTTKISYPEYLDEALNRVTRVPEWEAGTYAGPSENEAKNIYFRDTGWQTMLPRLFIGFELNEAQTQNAKRWGWFVLGQESAFLNMQITNTVWTGTPFEVHDLTQVQAVGGAAPTRWPEQMWEPVTEGATLGDYWVRVKLEESMGGHVYNTEFRTAVVSVWCDPPAAGGLCAVNDLVTGPIPARWQG